MDTTDTKCVMVIDGELPTGIISNTAAILGLTLGKLAPETIGNDVTDKSGNCHPGIITIPVPILKGNAESIRDLREKLYRPEYSQLTAADFSDVAQGCNDYGEFTGRISKTPECDLKYFGIAICGSKKLVNKLTGSMPLLR